MNARLGLLLLTALASLWSAPAAAFCRTAACDPKRGDVCQRDANGCVVGYLPLRWPEPCLHFSVQRDGSPKNGISADQLELAVLTAFEIWASADCGNGQHPGFVSHSFGKVQCDAEEFNRDHANANIYTFRDDSWPDDPRVADALGITTAHYNPDTGEVSDVDVEINGTRGNITDANPEDYADLLSIVTHETGHFLGLDHSSFEAAVMYAKYTPGGRSLRELFPDDILGVCALHPPISGAVRNDCRPVNGFSAVCAAEQKEPSGCGFARGSWQHALVFGLALGWLVRRRRAARRR